MDWSKKVKYVSFYKQGDEYFLALLNEHKVELSSKLISTGIKGKDFGIMLATDHGAEFIDNVGEQNEKM